MSHEKTTKESIRHIIKDIDTKARFNCPDCSCIDGEAEIEKAVNRIDLLIQTMMRQVKLGNKNVHER